ncbi:MAG: hypothetical protein ACOCWO_01950, partial [Candidatus Muiribacteriaceae bacterium]
MNKKTTFFLIICILSFLCFEAGAREEIFRYFNNRGLIHDTADIYNSTEELNSLEKAAMLSEILNRLTKSRQIYDVPNERLRQLQRRMRATSDDIMLVGNIDLDRVNDAIEQVIRKSHDRKYVSQSRPKPLIEKSGIKAEELLKRHMGSSKQKYYVVDPEFAPAGEQRKKVLASLDGDIYRENGNANSYFSIGFSSYQPGGSSFSYIDKEGVVMLNIGYFRNPRLAIDIRKMSYKSESGGSEFGVSGSDYSLTIEPISLSFKYRFLNYRNYYTYAGYGLSYISIEHTLNEPGTVMTGAKETVYAPYFYYGIEFMEKKGFSLYF